MGRTRPRARAGRTRAHRAGGTWSGRTLPWLVKGLPVFFPSRTAPPQSAGRVDRKHLAIRWASLVGILPWGGRRLSPGPAGDPACPWRSGAHPVPSPHPLETLCWSVCLPPAGSWQRSRLGVPMPPPPHGSWRFCGQKPSAQMFPG